MPNKEAKTIINVVTRAFNRNTRPIYFYYNLGNEFTIIKDFL